MLTMKSCQKEIEPEGDPIGQMWDNFSIKKYNACNWLKHAVHTKSQESIITTKRKKETNKDLYPNGGYILRYLITLEIDN